MNYNYHGATPHHNKQGYVYSSPYDHAEYVHHSPQYEPQYEPPRKHTRTASYSAYPPSPQKRPYWEPDPYPQPQREIYVSGARVKPQKQEYYSTFPTSKHTRTSSRKQSQPIFIHDDEVGDAGLPYYVYAEPRSKTHHGRKASADHYYDYRQEQVREEQQTKTRVKVRRSSTTSKSSPSKSKSQPILQATEADALRWKIPAGYSLKHWDPTEIPILLLGSAFDANALGKWIYDWTVFHLGASHPIAAMAGDLWLLLIKLAGKMKRSGECVDRIRNREQRETVEDFMESGKRLWKKFKDLLRECESYMLAASKQDGKKTMGKKAGTEFVDSIFGRDRQLEQTERLMSQIRLWNMRFDVNCESTLRKPSAA